MSGSVAITTDPSNRRKDYYVDRNVLERALEPYPTLRRPFLPHQSPPPHQHRHRTSLCTSCLRVVFRSVCTSCFNGKTLTGRSPVRRKTSVTPQPHPLEIPHFSSASLVEKYSPASTSPTLTTLQRGQPSFALANLVATKLHKTSGMMKKINKMVSSVYCLALQSFTDAKRFHPVESDVQVACRIFKHRHIEANLRLSETEKRNRIANQFTQMYQSSESSNLSSGLLTRLEIATTNMINRLGSISAHWILRGGREWLPLLCHAQLYSIPAQKVLSIIEKNFSDPNIREHLRLAISSIGQLQQDQQPGPSSSGTTGSTQRSLVLKKDRVVRISSHVPTIIRPRPDPRAKFYLK
eukprot:Em0544g1a